MTENGIDEIAMEQSTRRPWLRSLVLGMVILFCGGVIGSVMTAVYYHTQEDHGRRKDRLPQNVAERMQNKYGLTDDQRQRLQTVFDEHIKKLSAIRTEVQPRMDAAQEALRQGVESILTPEEAKLWREEFENMRKPWHQRDGGPPPPPPPGSPGQ